MDYNNRYIIDLVKGSIFDIEPNKPKKRIDWNYIFKKSLEQNIAGLLYCSVTKLDIELQPADELLKKWKNVMLTTIGLNIQRYKEFLKIAKIVFEDKITFIGLKGCIIRSIYPIPELRTMGDFDILVHPNEINKIIKIFEANGYIVQKDAFGIVCKKENFYWEIFTTTEEEMRVNPKKWDNLFFKNIMSNGTVYYPDQTLFLIHLIVHTGKHCLWTGAGIRNLCDIALFVNKYKNKINFDLVEIACKEQKVWNIYVYIINSIKQFFNVDISITNFPEKDAEKFVEYLLLNGVFGKQNNTIALQAAKIEDDNIGVLRKIFFPSVKLLDYRYKYLKKFPFLLPIAWINRLFSAIFRYKYSIEQMINDMKGAIEYSQERKNWINILKLKD